MPIRILFRLFFLAGLLAPGYAFALGVGQLEVRSALNQIFEAELPLVTSNPAELTGLAARIPRQEEFDRAGVERLELLSKLRFSVHNPPGGRSVVKMTSLEPIREPNFNLLLELVWPRGRMIREFTVQLDPELYANRQPPAPPPPVVVPPLPVLAAVAPPPVAAPAAPKLPPAPPVSFEGASSYGPVKPGETLAGIANRVRPSTAISLPQMMAILMAGNPTAFAGDNPNTLRAGARLKVPTPQALGVVTPVAPSAIAGPAVAAAPADSAPSSLPPASTLESAPPSAAAEPGTLSPPITAAPLPAAPVAEVASPAAPGSPPPSAEQLPEIVPKAAIPQSETPPPAAASPAAAPETAASPVAAPETAASPAAPAQPQPEVAAAPPAPPKPAPPPAEAESDWTSNPMLWVAMALIALAIAAVVLLPLLRRPARPKPSTVEAVAPVSPQSEPTTVTDEPPGVPTTRRTRLAEPGFESLTPVTNVAAAATPPDRVKPAPGSAGAPAAPRPIDELLKDFDFDLGGPPLPAAAARQGPAPAGEIRAPLFEAEPPTAPATHRPSAISLAEMATGRAQQFKQPEERKEPPVAAQAELSPESRLDGLDFDFGDLRLDTVARPQPSELPPLEMKPEAAGIRKPSVLPSLELGIAEPATEPPSLAPSVATPADAPMPDVKFEFADVSQEIAKHSAPEDSLKLEEALQGLGGDILKLVSQQENIRSPGRGTDAADYVETKLDLASAYLDMGDHVGARGLLEEVLREGDVAQKQRAEEFLKKLG